MRVIYKTVDGRYYTDHDIEKAFAFIFGKTKKEDEKAYFKWLKSLWNRRIAKVYSSENIPITREFVESNPVLAIRTYSDRYDISLKEAKRSLDTLLAVQEFVNDIRASD